jgi:ubiquinone/menaquinone biosynthesis C-methylase UbiE/PAS domain-containing protein
MNRQQPPSLWHGLLAGKRNEEFAKIVGAIVLLMGAGFLLVLILIVAALIYYAPSADRTYGWLLGTMLVTGFVTSFGLVITGVGVAVPDARPYLLRWGGVVLRRLQQLRAREPSGSAETTEILDTDGQAGAVRDLPCIEEAPPRIEWCWTEASEARLAFLDVVGPAYILNPHFQFIDWNPAFEELVAKRLGLTRGDHAGNFIKHLANCEAVENRSVRDFRPNHYPLAHDEELVLSTEEYGDVWFHKVAGQIADENGNIRAWAVHLDIVVADEIEKLWEDIRAVISREVTWSRYAVVYDKLLSEFDDYTQLAELVTGKVGNAQRCLDLGAGTGNGSLALLRGLDTREVWAVERNETMLQLLYSKMQKANGRDFAHRLNVVKEDMRRIDSLPSGYFDAAVLINSLYTVEDRSECLRQVARVLQPGGILALSTPHAETDVDKLFRRIREVLTEKGVFDQLRLTVETARERHEELDKLIHKDTKAEIRQYIEEAGFQIDDWHDSEYADAVVVVKAVKR